jgi:hypothetical protein
MLNVEQHKAKFIAAAKETRKDEAHIGERDIQKENKWNSVVEGRNHGFVAYEKNIPLFPQFVHVDRRRSRGRGQNERRTKEKEKLNIGE